MKQLRRRKYGVNSYAHWENVQFGFVDSGVFGDYHRLADFLAPRWILDLASNVHL